jgi:acetyltransferase
MIVPVVGRAELLGEDRRTMLVGLRAALGAATAAGRFAERVAAGLGPADRDSPDLAAIEPDRERFDRQIANLGQRAGDHETKVLLASYGIEVTRQAVATTPSAATRIAKKAGYPVDVKPWGPDLPGERDGCPVERGLTTAAEVRRAFASVAQEADLADGTPVIVRESPPPGREVSARIARVGPLGWMTLVDAAGAPGPAAAPAPLRRSDAMELARLVEATRVGDPEPDRSALAEALVRASFLAVDRADVIERLDMHRIVVFAKGDGAVVADAHAELRERASPDHS